MSELAYYQIRVQGHLEDNWLDWFEGLTIANLDNGEALLSRYVKDQAALHGLIDGIGNLGLPLLSVNRAYSVEGSLT